MSLSEVSNTIAGKPPVAQKIDGLALHFAKFPNGAPVRTLGNCAGASGIVLDFDGRGGDEVKRKALEAVVAKLGLAALFWDSFSADGKDTTFRCVLPSEAMIPVELYKSAARYVCENVLKVNAPKIHPASQAYFCQPKIGNSANARCFKGKAIDSTFEQWELTAEIFAAEHNTNPNHGLTLSAEQYEHARAVLGQLKQRGAHLSDGKGVWHRIIGSLAIYGDQGLGLALEFSEGDPEFSEKVVERKIQQKLKSGATSIANLFAIADHEFGIQNPGAGHRSTVFEDFADEIAPAEVAPPPSHPKQHDWPPGIVGEIATYILNSSRMQVPSFAIAGALAAASFMISNKSCVEPSQTGLNLYQVLIGNTGKGKEDPRKAIKRIVQAVLGRDAPPMPEILASGTALLKSLSNYPVLMMLSDEYGMFMQSAMQGKDDFRRDLVKELMSLYGLARSFHGGKKYANSKDNIDRIDYPYVVVLGTTTSEELFNGMSMDAINNGQANRNIYIYADADNPPNRRPVTELPFDLVERLKVLFNDFTDFYGMQYGPGAEEAIAAFGDNLPATGKFANLWSRAEESAIRIAGVLAFCDKKIITVEHVEWAIAYVKQSIEVFAGKAETEISEGVFDRMRNKALNIISNPRHYRDNKRWGNICKTGKMPRGMLTNLMKIKPRELDDVLSSLHEAGEISSATDNGVTIYWVRS